MNDRELLIRIDERVEAIFEKLDSGDNRFRRIETVQASRKCEMNEDRLKKLERATYGSAFGSVLILILFFLQWAWKNAMGGK